MSMLATLRNEHEGDIPIVVIEGEIDASNAPEISTWLRDALNNQGTLLLVDLTETTYLDSAGINALFKLGLELHERQQQLHLVVAAPSPVARLIAIVGLNEAVPTHPTRDAALAAVS